MADVTLRSLTAAGRRVGGGVPQDLATPRMPNKGTIPKPLSRHLAFQDFVLWLLKNMPSRPGTLNDTKLRAGEGWVAGQPLEELTPNTCPGLRALVPV